MDVGILAVFQNYQDRGDDAETFRNEMHIANLAEPLGFDKYWAVEHHFTNYSACPDNVQFLSYLAGRTSKIKLGTGAVIVPWNNPLRVAEKIVLLDHLSDGRAILGVGRGLARVEYEHFGIDMSESRERFDEGAKMIIDALESGTIEGSGPFYPQKATELRPRPRAGFRDRFYSVGMSPESVDQVAQLGARLMIFSQQPWETFADGALASYRQAYRGYHGSDAPMPLTGDLMFCHEDAGHAEEMAIDYMSKYFLSIIHHYELMSEHFEEVKGYAYYADAAALFAKVGLEIGAKGYCQVQTWGTPEMIIEKLERRRQLLGDYELNLISNYGGMPLEVAEKSIRLFAKEVLPEIHRW